MPSLKIYPKSKNHKKKTLIACTHLSAGNTAHPSRSFLRGYIISCLSDTQIHLEEYTNYSDALQTHGAEGWSDSAASGGMRVQRKLQDICLHVGLTLTADVRSCSGEMNQHATLEGLAYGKRPSG